MRYYLSSKLPPYVFEKVNALKASYKAKGMDVIDLGMGNPDMPTPAPIVECLTEAARDPHNHRYSAARGIAGLRQAMADRYLRKWNVLLDPEHEVVVTIGVKEGLSHLVMTLLAPGDLAVVPEPYYPIHAYAAIIAGGNLLKLPYTAPDDLLDQLHSCLKNAIANVLILSFPNNPTGRSVDLAFFEEVVDFARKYRFHVIHDFAYADLYYGEGLPPSILQVKGAKDVAVELYSLSKSYNMAGWRIGFCVGNRGMVGALSRVKSYMDYGVFQPIQMAGELALNCCDRYVDQIREEYRKRRDVLVEVLNQAGWPVEKPQGSMFLWANIPEPFWMLDSLEFSKTLLEQAHVAVSPGIGFGSSGDQYVRFALVESEDRIREAGRNIKKFLEAGPSDESLLKKS
jgi:alanine-synthesizing transaminase